MTKRIPDLCLFGSPAKAAIERFAIWLTGHEKSPDPPRRCILCVFGIALLLSTCQRAWSHDEPMSVACIMSSDQTVMLGEAIILHYKVSRTSDGPTIATLPDQFTGPWYSVAVTDANGVVVAATPARKRIPEPGTLDLGTFLFREGSVREGNIIVNRCVQLPSSGNYTLLVHVNLPYVVLGAEDRFPGNVKLSDVIKAGGLAIRHDFTFHVMVAAPDPEKLRSIAQNLRRKYMGADSSTERQYFLDSLMAMPPEFAAPSWRFLAFDTNLQDKSEVAAALAANRSLPALDILLEMQAGQPPADSKRYVKSPLLYVQRIYRVSSPEEKAQIDQMLIKHHLTLNAVEVGD